MKKKIILILTLLSIVVLFVVFAIVKERMNAPKYKYECRIINDFDSVMTINGTEYISVYLGSGNDIYDGKYEINGGLYKTDKLYALPNGETECDDNMVYTLENISPEEYLVKIASDYTGAYDGQLYKMKNNLNK